MDSDIQWSALKAALQTEIEAVYVASEEIILIDSNDSDHKLTLSSTALTLKVRNAPQFHAVRWDTETEYGFERLSEDSHRVAKALISRLREQLGKFRTET